MNLSLTILKNKTSSIPVVIFIILSAWWLYIINLPLDFTGDVRQIWAATYQIMAIYGVVTGLFLFKKIGGKNLLGRAILAFSVGLFLQSFGQSIYSYFIFYKHIEVPYPSIGDVGFFGSVILYILAAYSLVKMIRVKSLKGKLISILLPVIMLGVSYYFFLQGYEFDWSNKLKVFLDFGYPFGQAIYVSIAILAFLFSRNFLGGIMKKPIWILMFALIFQYCADFMFLYQYSKGTWYVGGINDYMYFVSYFFMTLALIYIGSTFNKIKSEGLMETPNIGKLGAGIVGTIPILNQIILAIIKRQERVAGQIAWEEAKEVPELTIINQQKEEISVEGNSIQNSRKVIDDLVSRYKHIFGDLAVQVSKDATRHLLAELPSDQVPDSLK